MTRASKQFLKSTVLFIFVQLIVLMSKSYTKNKQDLISLNSANTLITTEMGLVR